MNKTIIAVWGQENNGKTSTIVNFYNLLKCKYQVLKGLERGNDQDNDIVRYFKINDVKIAIESRGDPWTELKKRLKTLSQDNYDIIICSTRISGVTVEAVEELEYNGYDVIWLSNLYSAQKSMYEMNYDSGQFLLHVFEKVLNEKY